MRELALRNHGRGSLLWLRRRSYRRSGGPASFGDDADIGTRRQLVVGQNQPVRRWDLHRLAVDGDRLDLRSAVAAGEIEAFFAKADRLLSARTG